MKAVFAVLVLIFLGAHAAPDAKASPSVCSASPEEIVDMTVKLHGEGLDMDTAAKRIVNQIADCPNALQIVTDFQNQYGG